jgi:hypothetical protein
MTLLVWVIGALLAANLVLTVFAVWRLRSMRDELRRMTGYPAVNDGELIRIVRDVIATRRAMRAEVHRFPDEARKP